VRTKIGDADLFWLGTKPSAGLLKLKQKSRIVTAPPLLVPLTLN
jgi:hypothetical protein